MTDWTLSNLFHCRQCDGCDLQSKCKECPLCSQIASNHVWAGIGRFSLGVVVLLVLAMLARCFG
jgi:hypothetical protein